MCIRDSPQGGPGSFVAEVSAGDAGQGVARLDGDSACCGWGLLLGQGERPAGAQEVVVSVEEVAVEGGDLGVAASRTQVALSDRPQRITGSDRMRPRGSLVRGGLVEGDGVPGCGLDGSGCGVGGGGVGDLDGGGDRGEQQHRGGDEALDAGLGPPEAGQPRRAHAPNERGHLGGDEQDEDRPDDPADSLEQGEGRCV